MKKEDFDFYCHIIDNSVKLLKEEIEKQDNWSLNGESIEAYIVRLLFGYEGQIHEQRCFEAIEKEKKFCEEMKAKLVADGGEDILAEGYTKEEAIKEMDRFIKRLSHFEELIGKRKGGNKGTDEETMEKPSGV